ncbi:MAG: tyrosine-type recombinase/integrase, partial [Erysipelotrichales bacterium]|nr:tyrosine-type recombinase/integrase [Erysipelotrichales bacterium]
TKDVEAFLDTCKNYEQSTQNQIITTLRQFFKEHYIYNEMDSNLQPMNTIGSIKQNQHLPIFLSESEMAMFLNIPLQSDQDIMRKAIFEVLYCGGLRVSECANLQLNDLHFSANMIRFMGKGSKERVVLLHEEAIQCISMYITLVREKIVRDLRINSNALFIKKSGKIITRNDIYKLVKNRCMECGITKNISPHSLRHSYATHMLEEGANLVAIQELLGHADISTTQIYTHVTAKQMRDTYDKFFPKKK